MTRLAAALGAPLLVTLVVTPVRGQQAAAPTPELAVGAVAPDFTLPGATRYGTLRAPIHLSDFKEKTVGLAFFYKARTKG